MQTTDHAVARFRLVVLHKTHLETRLFHEIPLIETLEKIPASIAEDAGLDNLQSFYFGINYVHSQPFSSDTDHTGS